jgi:hypothetical protein
MAKHSAPDPDEVRALGEAVNDVFRSIVIDDCTLSALARRDGGALPDFPPEVVDAFEVLKAWAIAWEPGSPDLVLALNACQAGEVLTLATGYALAHQIDDHPDRDWVGCSDQTRVVYYACKLFAMAIEHGGYR